LVESSIHAIGQCAEVAPECTQQAISTMMVFIQSKHGLSTFLDGLRQHIKPYFSDVIVTNAVLVLKSLVQTHPSEQQNNLPSTVISRLAYLIDDITHPKSRSCAIWLVGQYACLMTQKAGSLGGIAEWAPDVLRRTCKTFTREVSVVPAFRWIPKLMFVGTGGQTADHQPSCKITRAEPYERCLAIAWEVHINTSPLRSRLRRTRSRTVCGFDTDGSCAEHFG
jgi:hypothetical protein